MKIQQINNELQLNEVLDKNSSILNLGKTPTLINLLLIRVKIYCLKKKGGDGVMLSDCFPDILIIS